MGLFNDTVGKINNLNNVLRVRENSDLAAKLTTIRHTVSVVSTSIIVLLLFVSLFIIANTIKVTMFNRRLEISIMKSVGATSWFIRWPFMLEGMILGALSGILALLAVWGVYSFAVHSLSALFSDLGSRSALPFSHYAGLMLLGFIAIGIVAGAGGSTFSISKYLKEQEFTNYEEKN
jgi:cell division transport system permease protein